VYFFCFGILGTIQYRNWLGRLKVCLVRRLSEDRDDDGVGAEVGEALEVARADAGGGARGGQWEAVDAS